MFLWDLFQFFPGFGITNYTGRNTLTQLKKLNKVFEGLEEESNNLFKFLTQNLLKANSEKLHLLTNTTGETQFKIALMIEMLLFTLPKKQGLSFFHVTPLLFWNTGFIIGISEGFSKK